MASEEGILVIAYDVAVFHNDAIYLSFDSVRVGYDMAKAVALVFAGIRLFWPSLVPCSGWNHAHLACRCGSSMVAAFGQIHGVSGWLQGGPPRSSGNHIARGLGGPSI